MVGMPTRAALPSGHDVQPAAVEAPPIGDHVVQAGADQPGEHGADGYPVEVVGIPGGLLAGVLAGRRSAVDQPLSSPATDPAASGEAAPDRWD